MSPNLNSHLWCSDSPETRFRSSETVNTGSDYWHSSRITRLNRSRIHESYYCVKRSKLFSIHNFSNVITIFSQFLTAIGIITLLTTIQNRLIFSSNGLIFSFTLFYTKFNSLFSLNFRFKLKLDFRKFHSKFFKTLFAFIFTIFGKNVKIVIFFTFFHWRYEKLNNSGISGDNPIGECVQI